MGKSPIEATVFDKSKRAIVHLRAQLRRQRLGLIFGSGASKGLGFPDWSELIDRIAAHPDVDAVNLLERCKVEKAGARSITRSYAAITQLLFSEYWRRAVSRKGLTEPLKFIEEQLIRSEWLEMIHNELYKNLTHKDQSTRLKNHPYLQFFKPIIKNTPLTVTYNFDDSLEKLLMEARSEEERETTRGFEVTDRPDRQFQNKNGIIYHPNGYLPSTFSDGSSQQVVFSDDAFQDQLISAATGGYVHLSNHLFRNTCLLVGLSLDDATLQSLLRQNAVNNPGNIHYIIHFLADDAKMDDDIRDGIFDSNFHSYNLYTLFLRNSEIAALARLISLEPNSFELHYKKKKPKLVYYIIGSIGAGKSTAAANFRNLITYDEWIDERKAALAQPASEVADQVPALDAWIAAQFHKKNYALSVSHEGIHLVDRCPLDPLTFTKPEHRAMRAKELIDAITDGDTFGIEPGHIIQLDCDIEDIEIRNSFKHKYWKREQYEELIEAIEIIYGPIEGVTRICTRGRDAQSVACEIAKVIFTGEYRPIDIEKELKLAACSSYTAPDTEVSL